ncbi:hypothetical protein ITI46_16550 [Streptomyces oryzae]|uniref:DUF6924 domain-containing protein n=1 Tax=Streptomyces oryzae TaxID=1434886 RepID=A0ABS3XD10_9ACTN|nr:hypothetical protein [Streptomyces oryzae]MBO8193265.1 hypothetical protein [Streptomyces oryzae]
MRPPLPLPPDDDARRVPGMLLLRTGDDDAVWDDVLTRMGELPGIQGPPGHEPGNDTRTPTSLPRRLVVAHDPAWRGASLQEVTAALAQPGIWVPDLVLLTDERTARNPKARPLLAFGRGYTDDDGDGDLHDFWITPRQAAMTYLVLHQPSASFAVEHFAERAPTEPEWEVEEGEELTEEHLYEPVGSAMETLASPPRYTRPARELPTLSHETDLLVRTDFADDAAWAALVEAVSHSEWEYDDTGEDWGDYIHFVDDPAFAGATPEQVMAQVLADSEDEADGIADVVLIADATTLHEPEHRILVVPMTDDIGLTFRVDPGLVGLMLVNLGISNQDIDDYRDDNTR